MQIWDTALNKVISEIAAGHIGAEEPVNVYAISFSAASDRVAVISQFEGVCQIFAIPSGEIVYDETGISAAVYQQPLIGVVLL